MVKMSIPVEHHPFCDSRAVFLERITIYVLSSVLGGTIRALKATRGICTTWSGNVFRTNEETQSDVAHPFLLSYL
jgi:hypothetical protein